MGVDPVLVPGREPGPSDPAGDATVHGRARRSAHHRGRGLARAAHFPARRCDPSHPASCAVRRVTTCCRARLRPGSARKSPRHSLESPVDGARPRRLSCTPGGTGWANKMTGAPRSRSWFEAGFLIVSAHDLHRCGASRRADTSLGRLIGACFSTSRSGNGKDMVETDTLERERKFEAADDVRLPDVPGASVIDGSDVRLTATYWDTAHRHLLRWGHTLRHRRASDGSEDRWTLKLSIPSWKKKGELRRAEVHVPGSRLYPPVAIRQLARAVLRRGVLTPIAIIEPTVTVSSWSVTIRRTGSSSATITSHPSSVSGPDRRSGRSRSKPPLRTRAR